MHKSVKLIDHLALTTSYDFPSENLKDHIFELRRYDPAYTRLVGI